MNVSALDLKFSGAKRGTPPTACRPVKKQKLITNLLNTKIQKQIQYSEIVIIQYLEIVIIQYSEIVIIQY